uniref:G-patch domain-containing protein n=1 Tax=Caenorhabditis japonica TaxID=281687 RepID=A0A8R1HIZ4_CAEJA
MKRSFSNKSILDRYLEKSKQKLVKSAWEPVSNSDWSYAVVRNIPKELHSKDLRKYFSRFIEAEKFECFHYKHRPELQAAKEGDVASKSVTCCCIVALKSLQDREEFIAEFHKRNWINVTGAEIPRRCFVDRLRVKNSEGDSSSDMGSISETDLRDMVELKPPTPMPKGNIGTPTQYFLEQIRLCRMPTYLINKLGITTNSQIERRKKRFVEVHFQYEGSSRDQSGISGSRTETVEDSECPPEDPTEKIYAQQNPRDNDDGEDADDDQCEEWERHEALHDDVTEQDRANPRKYEEEMEVTWEKGGPGLVWYTDKNYWDEKEKGTDCDWKWADDWDVDYSVYYEGKSAGDMDAKAAVEIRNDERQRAGKMEQSVFTMSRNPNNNPRKRKRHNSDSDREVAVANLHKGVGGSMLAKMGWTPGSGLGRNEQGKVIPVAVQLEEDGQSGKERSGFGYVATRNCPELSKNAHHGTSLHLFDKVTDQEDNTNKHTGDTTTSEILYRRPEPIFMKYRDTASKKCL